jgi:biopolymer transport protein ExbB/TolQ
LTIYEATVSVLFILSEALLYPVILVLLLLFGWSLALVGSLISEYTSRHRDLGELESVCLKASEMAKPGRMEQASAALDEYKSHAFVSQALREMAQSLRSGTFPLKVEKILQEAELGMGKALEPIRIVVRVGPMLGLMGTLIPRGPALINLTSGNIEQMAHNLAIAFSTTVIGLAVGGICYGIYQVRSRWYRQDLSDLEYAVEIMRGAWRGEAE